MARRDSTASEITTTPTTAPAGRFEWEKALRSTPGIPLPTRGVWLMLATWAQTSSGENVRPSIKKLATTLQMDRKNLGRHVEAGVSAGWLTPTGTTASGVTIYRLTIPAAAAAPVDLEDDQPQEGGVYTPHLQTEGGVSTPHPLPKEGGVYTPHPLPKPEPESGGVGSTDLRGWGLHASGGGVYTPHKVCIEVLHEVTLEVTISG